MGTHAFMPLVERAILTGGTCNQPILEFGFCADLIHAGEHVTQLVGKGVGGIVDHHARPVGHREIRAQQVADGTFVTTIRMVHMRGEHATDDHVLFGAVEQLRQRQTRTRAHGRHDAEGHSRQCGDRSGLRNRGQLTNHPVAQVIGDLPTRYRHHGLRIAIPPHRGDQRT